MVKKAPDEAPREDEVDRLRLYQHIVADVARLAATDPGFDEFLRETVHQVGRAVDIDRIKVLRYRPEHGDLLVQAGVGWKEGVVGKATLPIDLSSPPGRAIQTGQVSVEEDMPGSREFKLSGLLRDHDIVSLINAPIGVEGTIWGVLEADSREPRHFSPDTVRFMETIANLVGTMVQRKSFEARLAEAEAETAREISQRETLLREMQHRVKNNLQLIISMLLIKQMKAAGTDAAPLLQTVANRISAIALAHDQLDPRQGLRSVDLATYLSALCRQIANFHAVEIEPELDRAVAPIDSAVALGLIVNELVTNAVKHAANGPGTIRVILRAGSGTRESCLCVADQGKGKFIERPGSSGTRLLDALAGQVRGRIEREHTEQGISVRVFFPPTE